MRNYRNQNHKWTYSNNFFQRNNSLFYCYRRYTYIAVAAGDDYFDKSIYLFEESLTSSHGVPLQNWRPIQVEQRQDNKIVLSLPASNRTIPCWSEVSSHESFDQLKFRADKPKKGKKKCHGIRELTKVPRA
jgi:hypothetical protein